MIWRNDHFETQRDLPVGADKIGRRTKKHSLLTKELRRAKAIAKTRGRSPVAPRVLMRHASCVMRTRNHARGHLSQVFLHLSPFGLSQRPLSCTMLHQRDPFSSSQGGGGVPYISGDPSKQDVIISSHISSGFVQPALSDTCKPVP